MLQALTATVSDRGYQGTTVTMIVGRARASRRTFYEHFDDCDDCFLAAFDDAIGHMADVAAAAYERPGKWSERMRAALEAIMGFLEHQPATAQLVFVESLRAGPKVLARRATVMELLRVIVDQGRSQMRLGRTTPALTAETVVGGVITVVQTRLARRASMRLVPLVNPLMAAIVLPYLGSAAASRELARPTPKAPRRLRVVAALPRREAETNGVNHMRVTHRTLRVLAVIAETPGAGNRDIAVASGISDQGQISRLLARLQKLELIESVGERHRTGPHQWHLTERGEELRQDTDRRARAS
jgi:AcrR family transcriptional regulator